MIVPMRKVYILLPLREEESLLRELGRSGIFHIHQEPGVEKEGDPVLSIEENISIFERVLERLEKTSKDPIVPYRGKGRATLEEFVRETDSIFRGIDTWNREIEEITGEMESGEIWGEFRRSDLRFLKQKGLSVRFFTSFSKDFEKYKNQYPLYIVKSLQKKVFFVAIHEGELTLPFGTEIELKHDPETLLRLYQKAQEELSYLQSEIKERGWLRSRIKDELEILKIRHRIALAKNGFVGKNEISILSGFLPREELSGFKKNMTEKGWGVFDRDVLPEDPAPTLVRNRFLSRLFQPVLKFLEVLPGYGEFDANSIFIVFFSIFFAMLIGDAGYGATMLVVLEVLRRWKPLHTEQYGLFLTLSLTTIAWGAVNGLWFGSETLVNQTFLRYLVIPELNAFVKTNDARMIQICFILGVVQLSIAHFWIGLRSFPNLRSLAEAGWISFIVGLYFIANAVVLDRPIDSYVFFPLFAGALLIFACSEQREDGFLKGVTRGLVQFPFNLLTGIGCFSDLVSYIRLFAVGLATKEVAVAFNRMALESGFETVGATLLSVFILIFGHTINMLLGAMSVLVHGVRLNFLEFSRHLGMEWSGVAYKPFLLDNLSERTEKESEQRG